MERDTVDIYERRAITYRDNRPTRLAARAAALGERKVPGLAAVDLGCGPGMHLESLGDPVVALDAATAMLELVGQAAPRALRVRADLEALPFRARSLGGAWARASYLHVRSVRLPLALAHLHAALAVGAPFEMSVHRSETDGVDHGGDLPGRFFAGWQRDPLVRVVEGAGFGVDESWSDDEWVYVAAHRQRTLPDFVSQDMQVLVCGLNPSLAAADAGYGYAGPTNRFWPAALEAALVTRARDPWRALAVDRVGMTDLVKRATPRAAELDPDEYAAGAGRLRALVAWLRPRLVLFVGLSGWRVAVDPAATAGLQPGGFGGAKAYVMPSSSGLNAHARREDLVRHVRAARSAAAAARDGG